MKKKLVELGTEVLEDTEKQKSILSDITKFMDDGRILCLMVRDYISGEYTRIPLTAVAIAAGALVYLLMPDAIPGAVDDIAVVTMAISALGSDLNDYREWKSSNEKVLEVSVVTESGKIFVVKGDAIPLHISDRLKEIQKAEEGAASERTPICNNK